MAKTKKTAVRKPAARTAAEAAPARTKKTAVTTADPLVQKAPNKREGSQPVEVQAPAVVQATVNAQLQYPVVDPDQPRKQPVNYERAGISPDVTQAGPPDPVLTDGRADHADLAPGQSLAPSPPISSSNILPQAEKPSFG